MGPAGPNLAGPRADLTGPPKNFSAPSARNLLCEQILPVLRTGCAKSSRYKALLTGTWDRYRLLFRALLLTCYAGACAGPGGDAGEGLLQAQVHGSHVARAAHLPAPQHSQPLWARTPYMTDCTASLAMPGTRHQVHVGHAVLMNETEAVLADRAL